jgi:hypothetical protein
MNSFRNFASSTRWGGSYGRVRGSTSSSAP